MKVDDTGLLVILQWYAIQSRCYVPDLRRAIHASGRQPIAVRRERDRLQRGCMSVQGLQTLAGRDFADTYCAVLQTDGQPPAILREGQGIHLIGLHIEGEAIPGGGIPQPDDSVAITGRQPTTVRRECQAQSPIFLIVKEAYDPAGSGVP